MLSGARLPQAGEGWKACGKKASTAPFREDVNSARRVLVSDALWRSSRRCRNIALGKHRRSLTGEDGAKVVICVARKKLSQVFAIVPARVKVRQQPLNRIRNRA